MPQTPWIQPYLRLEKEDLETECAQLFEEGRVIPPDWFREYEFLLSLPDFNSSYAQKAVSALIDAGNALPFDPDCAADEPSDLEAIRAARPDEKPVLPAFDYAKLDDKIRGGWLGRMAGCLLGKPVEGWMRGRLREMLQTTGNWPLQSYMPFESVDEATREKFEMTRDRWWIDTVDGMPEDDDINYSFIGKLALERGGRDFSPIDIANLWLSELPPWHTYTAERVAIRNFLRDIAPPASARFRNPYREWIGAQIRADFFGWASPSQPEQAAEWAWRDACVSHVGNGIYGEIWVAAMLAGAAVLDDVAAVIETGLAQIPAECRLTAAIRNVMKWYADGKSFDEFMVDFNTRWDDACKHHWCHTISNAELVAAALLWGEKDFGKTICLAVQPGFDTDCNGATAGSVLGVMLGGAALPQEWIAPLGNTVTLGLAGYHRQDFDTLFAESANLVRKLNAVNTES